MTFGDVCDSFGSRCRGSLFLENFYGKSKFSRDFQIISHITMSTADPKKPTCCKLGLKPLTVQNLLFYYAPAQGVLSYTALSVNVMNPSLVLRIFPKRDVTNILLFNALVGSGLFLYNRPHLAALTTKEKLLYSSFGAVTFSLGSVLIWAIVRSVLPQNVALCTFCGIGSGLALIKVGKNYVSTVDSLVAKKS